MNQRNYREIGRRVKEVRTLAKLRQEDFAERIDVTQSTVAQFESGDNPIKDRYIKLICSEFNINQEWLLYGSGTMLNSSSISFEEFASLYNISTLEMEFLKTYLDIDKEIRRDILEKFMTTFVKFNNENKLKK